MVNEIVVVGAGVIGLTCALLLSEQGYKVKIVAAHFPSDPLNTQYTSPWAGAHFRPAPSRTESDKREFGYTRKTLEYFKKVSTAEPESSIRFLQGEEWFEKADPFYKNLSYGYSEGLEDFEVLPENQLPPNVDFGTSYTSWVLNSPLYIQYLQRKLAMFYGVEFVKANLNSLKQVSQMYPASIIVNASGQGLQYSGGYDSKSFPIRGQTLLIRVSKNCPYKTKTITHQSANGLWTFVIPRPLDGGVILGGTKQPNNFLSTPNEQDTQDLIQRAKVLYPHLFIDGKIDIRNVNVGFRPARQGGSRVEIEKIEKVTIIHAYGAGGMGYEVSYGIASEVLKLLVDVVGNKPKL